MLFQISVGLVVDLLLFDIHKYVNGAWRGPIHGSEGQVSVVQRARYGAKSDVHLEVPVRWLV